MIKCTICCSNLKTTSDDEVYYCIQCDHYQYIGNNKLEIFDHPKLSKSLESLRKNQSKKIVNKFKIIYPSLNNLTAIEVGAGKGYLIKEFKKVITKCYALDMDTTYKNELEDYGIKFKEGNLDDKNNFNNIDIVIGSHVFEHLVDPNKFLNDVDLYNIKFLILFIPNSRGFIFSFGKVLNKLGISLLWERLFQKNSNSPHYHYFSKKSMTKIAEKNNFKIVASLNLNMVNYIPNFKRVSATESFIISIASSVVLSFLELMNKIFRVSDSKVYYLKRINE
tara:strand:- start:103 stop:939 length:837 start_codon:yes stop_codon:yes gene_type:complete